MSSSTGRSSLILSCLLLLQGLRLGYFCLVSQGAPASTVCLLLLLPLLQGLRIDYFLLTPGLLDKVVACEMVPTPPKWSDHTGTGGAGGEYLPGCKGGAAEAERGVCVCLLSIYSLAAGTVECVLLARLDWAGRAPAGWQRDHDFQCRLEHVVRCRDGAGAS